MVSRYRIDVAWLDENRRSFASLAGSRLCGQQHGDLHAASDKPAGVNSLLEVFRQCCSQQEGFISVSQPLMESLFRLFLATSNRPLTLQGIIEQLRARRGERVPPPEVLQALLDKDTFYGLRRLPEDASE
ncbi:MAG: hypothetical protein HY671_15490 [Chloroflexi bacterium]|nr:hypothetical protein [Chloroflexota bacterium]